ncbi:hypothetical protein SUGI_1037170 [Cryptomeria japonica]|nr:hypothetical protein SUGI_1037170 [Cryptomeria japonica]
MGRRAKMMMIVVLELLCFIPTMVYSSGDNPGEQVMGFRVNMRHIDCYERSLSKRTQSAVERSKRQAEMISATLRRKQMEIHASVDAAGGLWMWE